MQVLSRKIDRAVLDQFLSIVPLTEAQLNDEQKVTAWAESLHASLLEHSKDGNMYQHRLFKAEDGRYGVELERWLHGNKHLVRLDPSLFSTVEYKTISALADKLSGIIGDEATVKRGEKEHTAGSFAEVMEWLMKEARRGQTVQRYKGLGEMNPEQLWETTMNSADRRMLQVKIEDAMAADEVFTTLMGDQVEPRRDFIERNALSVSNLDV
jgi:DNA gyrase subunit B